MPVNLIFKMIRISLALLCTLLLPGALFAERVPVEKARRLAAGMFRPAATASSLAASGSDLQLVWDGETAATRSGSDPAFYVFNRTGGGFAVIAGDDAARPVLGYSPTGRFVAEHRPENIRKWFAGIRGQILAAREAGLSSAEGAWNAVSASTVGNVVRSLETAQWDQDAPYNNLCPTIGGERAYTGCVATAAAIVMRYHRWPASGTGTLPDYTYTVPSTGVENTVQGHALGQAYAWDDMPLTYTDAATAKQKTAVAQLMYDLGVMSCAMYDTESTGMFTEDLAYGLMTYMGYDKSALLRYRDWSGLEDWDALIRKDIDDFGPVLYAGASEDVGHQFVIDGYTDAGYFCVNWGWGGYCNGQYLLSALDPDERGIGGGSASSGGFVFQQSALLGLRKDTSGSSEWASQLIVGASGSYYGLKASVSDFQTGSSFTMEVMYLFNTGFSAFDGVYELAVCDSRGQYKESISTTIDLRLEAPDAEGLSGMGAKEIPCKIKKEICPGDRIRVRYRANGESAWKWASGLDENTVAEIILAEEVDPEAIDANTSLHFDRASRRMTLSTLAGVNYRLTSADGAAAVAEGDSGSSGTIAIDASRLQGSYLLHLEREGAEMRLSLKF